MVDQTHFEVADDDDFGEDVVEFYFGYLSGDYPFYSAAWCVWQDWLTDCDYEPLPSWFTVVGEL